jgi:hypothetical protein
MMNDETSKRMEIGAPVPAAPTRLDEAKRRRKLPSEGWSGTACSIDYELRAVPEAGAPGGSATCYPQSSISHSRFSRIHAVEKPFYHGWTQMNTDQQKCIKSFEGRARHFRRRLAMAGQAVRAVVGVSAGGGQRTARPTVPDLLSVSIRVHPWFNYI